MDSQKLTNVFMKPVDTVLNIPISLSKAVGLYPHVRNGLYTLTKTALNVQYSLLNQLKAEGLEFVPETGGAILAVNHQSWLDAQVLTAVIPRNIHLIAKSELFDWPVIRFVVELADSLKITRGGDSNGLQDVISCLESGSIVGIFPEGTIPGEEQIPRSAVQPETGLLRGRTGVVRMAALAGVPIIPVGISGTGKTFPPEMYPRLEQLPLAKIGVPITVRVGPPVDYSSVLVRLHDDRFDYDSLKMATCLVMRSISRLVDHSMNYEPLEVEIPKIDEACSPDEAGFED